MQRTYTMYNDPGHAWLKCSKAELIKSGIAHKITPYSYMDKRHAYLEEDQDAGTFIKALQDKGIEIKIEERHTNEDSPIRNYQHYHRIEEETLSIKLFKNEINRMLKESTCKPEIREGMKAVLEIALHQAGVYKGYKYISTDQVPHGQKPGIQYKYSKELYPESLEIIKDPIECANRFEDTDKTRVEYF